MINAYALLNKTISFNVYPSALLGESFEYCKIVSIFDAASAEDTGRIDPQTMHATVYPTIPAENLVSDNYKSYNYLKVQLQNGEFVFIGEPWIIESSVEEFSSGTITAVFSNCQPDDVTEIKRILSKNGKNAEVSYKEN